MAMLQMMELRLREVGDIPVVTELSCVWSAVLLSLHQSAKLGTLSALYTGKAKKVAPRTLGLSVGYPIRLPLSFHDFPKASVN